MATPISEKGFNTWWNNVKSQGRTGEYSYNDYSGYLNSMNQPTNTPTPQTPTAQTPQTPQSDYTGSSVVDYLSSVGQKSDFTSRSQLAQQQGIQNYQGTAEQNLKLLQNLRQPKQVDTSAVTPDLMKPEEEIKIEQRTTNDFLSEKAIASARTDAEALAKLLKPQETETSQKRDELLDALYDDIDTLTGRGTAQLEAEEERGITGLNQQIATTAGELNKKLAEIDALTAAYNSENTRIDGSTTTLLRMSGKQAQLRRQYLAEKNMLVAEAGLIQAQANGLQGNLTAAQASADRAVELMYADREASYNAKNKPIRAYTGQTRR
jgi:hypothetical protein